MKILLLIHLFAVGIWLGCILTEAVFEHGMPQDALSRQLIARLHVMVDKFVEVPAFLVVLISGGAMLHNTLLSGIFTIKIVCALAAILLNIYCVRLVFRRRAHIENGDMAAFEAIDTLQHKVGGAVLGLLCMALLIGAYRFVL